MGLGGGGTAVATINVHGWIMFAKLSNIHVRQTKRIVMGERVAVAAAAFIVPGSLYSKYAFHFPSPGADFQYLHIHICMSCHYRREE